MNERLKWVRWLSRYDATYRTQLPDGRFVYVWRGTGIIGDRVSRVGDEQGQWWYSNEGAPDERCHGPVRTMRAAQIAAMLLGPED